MNHQLTTPSDETLNVNWTDLTGTILEGGYEIQELLQLEPRRTVLKARVLGDRSIRAVATFLALEPAAAEEQVRRWQAARSIRHPNISSPLALGSYNTGTAQLVYVITVSPDETLASALRERALDSEEASEVFLSLARALRDLHANGFVHGFLSPREVLAVGQSIQLSTVSIYPTNSEPLHVGDPPAYRAPEVENQNVTAAADVWCLGATTFEAVTQTACDDKCLERLPALPGRLGVALESCLRRDPETRPTAAFVLDMLEGRVPVPPPKGASPAARPTASIATASSEPKPEGAVPSSPPPFARDRVEQRRLRDIGAIPVKKASARPWWLYAAAGLLLAIVLLWAARPHRSSANRGPVQPIPQPSLKAKTASNRAPAAEQPATKESRNPDGTAWQTRTLAPDSSRKPAQQPLVAESRIEPSRRANAPIEDQQVWRVVAFTYNREKDAEKKAASINSRHPQLDAKVFSPRGHSVRYLVALGGFMSRDEAASYRMRAIRSGMPHDTYIQNY